MTMPSVSYKHFQRNLAPSEPLPPIVWMSLYNSRQANSTLTEILTRKLCIGTPTSIPIVIINLSHRHQQKKIDGGYILL
uniref:Uncharacterized protein n=1 Tax=Octopus bimaculoides TaxID=37653 RepID=A0A0L8H4R3_OCTBM